MARSISYLRFLRIGRPAALVRAPRPRAQRIKQLALLGLALTVGIWGALGRYIPGQSVIFELDHPSPVSVTAARDAVFESAVQTEEKRTLAESREENLVRVRDNAVPAQQRAELSQLLITVARLRADRLLTLDEQVSQLTALPNSSVVLSPTLAANLFQLNGDAWQNLQRQSLDLYDRAMASYDYEISQESLAQLRDRDLPYWTGSLPPQQSELALYLTRSFLRVNSTLDLEATAARKRSARDGVAPVTVRIQMGESIVRQGDPVRATTLEKLTALGLTQQQISLPVLVGNGLLAALLALVFVCYLGSFQGAVADRPRSLVTIAVLLLVTLAAARLLLPLWPAWSYAFPLATAVLVLTVLFNGPLAMAATTMLAVALGVMADSSLPMTATMFLGAGTAIFLVRRAERSIGFLLAGLAVTATTAATQIAFWSQTPNPRWEETLQILIFSGLNGGLSAVLALGLFHIVGRAAGIVTPIQLMELAHPNQPLLRKLIREAPGTYYHSVSVGNLAESAAEAIRADALLLRVAAYYHDIGKTIRPYFFTDNQMDRENVHDELEPRISAEIIADHVREGVKMAQAAGLPQPIIDFIATHHGTSVIRNFYQLALQREDSVNMEDYRYPGPKPFTREQGILMLADSVEATVRSKAQNGKLLHARADDQTRAASRAAGRMTLEEMVTSIIDERMQSGQLDNTPLTLQDLARIKQAFVTSLQGIYHPRADYAPQIIKV